MKSLFFLLIVLLPFAVPAQDRHPFYDDVQAIKRYDQMYQVPAHPIVFVGSSSIRKWERLQEVFGTYNVVNRGIGGAVINDITYFLDDLVFAYKPRQIVLYVGENDLPHDDETADTILNRTIVLYNAIRAKLPDVPIVYISLKPSPSREQYMPKCEQANELIKKYFAGEQKVTFVDVYHPMLKDGKPRKELFQQDMLHMTPEGYGIWEKAVRFYLLERGKKI